MAGNLNIDQLVTEAKNGSQSAISTLYEIHKRPMFGICIRMTGERNKAEDVLQEAFVIAFKSLNQLKKNDHFGGWLRRIVINECIRFSKASFHWKEINEITTRSEEDDTQEDSWVEKIDLETIHEEIKALPAGYRQVFNLFAIEDLPHKEIARMLGITESTSKTQYYKAKELLKKRLLQKIKYGQL